MTESKLDTTRRIRAELVERWPALFNEGKPVPLAIGIRKTLLAAMPKVTDELIGRVLRSWCFRPQYLAALTAGADRHGLEGIDGTVSTIIGAALAHERRRQVVLEERHQQRRIGRALLLLPRLL